MRDPSRIPEVLEAVEQLWRLHPDWRLGQLISNLAAWADPVEGSTYDLEDDELVQEIERHLPQATSEIAS